MKTPSLNEIIDRHFDRCSDFDASLELVAVAVSELKNIVGEIRAGKDKSKEVENIKHLFSYFLETKFGEEDKKTLRKFISNYVLLCEELLQLEK